MAVSSTLSRVGNIDFFGILPSGFFILSSAAFTITAIVNRGGDISFAAQAAIIVREVERWPVAVTVVFASYVLGIIPRSFTVAYTDDFCTKYLAGVAKSLARDREWVKRLYDSRVRFPYIIRLESIRDNLREMGYITWDVNLPDATVPGAGMFAYNYWKAVLKMHLHDFDYLREREARVRLFAGMFWAGFAGSVSGLIVFLIGPYRFEAFFLLLISILLALSFGSQLRSVRAGEASETFIAYLALVEDRRHE